MEELEQAHNDYEKRKRDIIANLNLIKLTTENYVVKGYLNEAIEFIKEREI